MENYKGKRLTEVSTIKIRASPTCHDDVVRWVRGAAVALHAPGNPFTKMLATFFASNKLLFVVLEEIATFATFFIFAIYFATIP